MKREVTIRYGFGDTAVGPVLVALTDKGICALTFQDRSAAAVAELARQFPGADLVEDPQAAEDVIRQVSAFLAGQSSNGELSLDLHGTAFQKRVWRAMQQVPRGQTCTYSDLARRAGYPRAARAVGRACATNPVAIFVPCHRIVAKDGLGGYGGCIERKRELLRREGVETIG